MGEGRGEIVQSLLEMPGSPYYAQADKIREHMNEISLIERWGWTLQEVRSLDEHDKMWLQAMLAGIIAGENKPKPKK